MQRADPYNLGKCLSSKQHVFFGRMTLTVTSPELDLVEQCQRYLAGKDVEAVEVRATALRELATIRLHRLLQDEDYFNLEFGRAA